MKIDSQTAERVLNNVLEVCLYSGTRARGIFNVMDDNRAFMQILLERPDTRSRFIWMEDVLTDNDRFFESLLAALRPTFPAASAWRNPVYDHCIFRGWPGRNYGEEEIIWSEAWAKRNTTGKLLANRKSLKDCYSRVVEVCLFTDRLLDTNRQVLETLLANPDALSPGPESWLEEFDLFFMDVRQAVDLDEIYKERPNMRTIYRPWPGKEQEHMNRLLAARRAQLTVEDRKCILSGRQVETPKRHSLAARVFGLFHSGDTVCHHK
ncbi:MAG TPA: hypothetical protein DEB25_06370 [Desulfobulbaceae bacterium]|nr:hypothetical protein [Desulfobulbaceae bacterium]